MRRTALAIGLLLTVHGIAQAQAEFPFTDGPLAPPVYSDPIGPPPHIWAQPEAGNQPLTAYPDPLGEPPWCESPYRNSAWRIELSFIPTASNVSEDAFGDWDENSGLALRLGLGYEDADGYGMRLLFWGFDHEADTLIGDVDLSASTFYWDFYKRFFVEEAELVFGGGLAGSHLEYDLNAFNDDANYSGGGISIFGEGYYPFLRFQKTDVGSIARARIALLSGRWSDDGTPFVNDTDHDVMSIVELAWGLEIRRRFGPKQDKYWYFDIVPEFQRWESASLPDPFDPGFQGTNFTFGLAW
jgi:hypothetical protein